MVAPPNQLFVEASWENLPGPETRSRYTAHRMGCATKVVLRGAFKHPASLASERLDDVGSSKSWPLIYDKFFGEMIDD